MYREEYPEHTYSQVLHDSENSTPQKQKRVRVQTHLRSYSLGPFCRLRSLSLSRNILLRILPLGDLGITSMNPTPTIATY